MMPDPTASAGSSIPIPDANTVAGTPAAQKGAIVAMQDSTQLVLEQAFAQAHELSLQAGNRQRDGSDNVAEQTRLLFLTRSQGNDLAQDILDQRSAGGQPQAAGGPTPK
jgi:hypothetical protein